MHRLVRNFQMKAELGKWAWDKPIGLSGEPNGFTPRAPPVETIC